jgi:hypothetical protein
VDPQNLWRTLETAEFLNKSEKWVRENREKLGIPSRKLGRHIRYVPIEVMTWFESQPK